MRALVITCLLASLASAKPRKAKKPRKAPAKPAPVQPTAPPEPAPAPVPEPAPAAPAPAPAAPIGKPRIAVIGDPVVAQAFGKAIGDSVELVATDGGEPRALAARHGLHAVIAVSVSDGTHGLAIVYQGSDGSELGRVEAKAGKYIVGKKLAPEVIAKLGDRLAHATAPPPGVAVAAAEPASSSLGVNTFRTKLIIYIVTAACTGIVGALIFLQKLRVSPEAGFSVNDWTVVVIFMVVIGGIGTIEGPFIGMLVYIILRELLADYGTFYLMLMGAIAIVVMLKAPGGIWGWVVQRYDLHLFPVGRRLVLAPPDERAAVDPPR